MLDTLEIKRLKEALVNDECKCEVNHIVTTCSNEVTHRYSNCEFSQLSCFNAIVKLMNSDDYRNRSRIMCTCGRRAEDCWTIIPV